ncbi:hypothetical protein GCM10010124_37480 [Pilimelia terevasa]|uniref:Heavy metal transporter n=1 Tax=Pilimelia terevasa TaxID=53372 RepID=A0A8J3BVP2_9ACTN|nr:hypothetical protein [Pilimelia terevasa]GGK41088.1 hypothetical protein GCM10010124_37480 [Pilimelia terevasa]
MSRGRKVTAVVVTAVAAVVVAGFGVVVVRDVLDGLRLAAIDRHCTVKASGEVALDADQTANAATIAAMGVRQEMPERAVVVALATALQESKLKNLPGGDRDSVGLFQQRPSMGWGSPKQIRNPRYAARKFYQGLAKVRGWERMRVTDAAQHVQRSAFPQAYEKWVDEAEVLTRALLGRATGAVACTVPRGDSPADGAATTSVLRGLRLDWGDFATSGVDTHAVTVAPGSARHGWRYAHWLVAHAAAHGVRAVSYAGLRWTAERGDWGASPEATGRGVTAEVFTAG